jgi:D-glycero-D-manno-heptose 1,7-bisphosphate phosphatase
LLKKVVFLDRDGTINRDSRDYIKSREEFEFLPGSLKAIEELTANGFTIVVITNQSALPRKLISLEELERIHTMMCKTVQSNKGKLKDIFYCPHMPDDDCDCRKPAPGLILRAQSKYSIDLADAVMVGDSHRDIECGHKRKKESSPTMWRKICIRPLNGLYLIKNKLQNRRIRRRRTEFRSKKYLSFSFKNFCGSKFLSIDHVFSVIRYSLFNKGEGKRQPQRAALLIDWCKSRIPDGCSSRNA